MGHASLSGKEYLCTVPTEIFLHFVVCVEGPGYLTLNTYILIGSQPELQGVSDRAGGLLFLSRGSQPGGALYVCLQ